MVAKYFAYKVYLPELFRIPTPRTFADACVKNVLTVCTIIVHFCAMRRLLVLEAIPDHSNLGEGSREERLGGDAGAGNPQRA